MFGFIKNTLQSVYNTITCRVASLFTREQIDESTLQELEKILLCADVGARTTRTIMQQLRADFSAGKLDSGAQLHSALEKQLIQLLTAVPACVPSDIVVLVGVNGSGKTTTAAKLIQQALKSGKKPLLVAADTYRAAATEQLSAWATRLGVPVVTGKAEQDPASVVYTGCVQYIQGDYSYLVIDTAGRVQTKTHLMQELEKMSRIIAKHVGDKPVTTLLTLDSMLGQNSLEQARLFNNSVKLSGVILTKMDGTGKGGIVFAIADELKIPVVYITYGEHPEHIKPFEPKAYVEELLGGD